MFLQLIGNKDGTAMLVQDILDIKKAQEEEEAESGINQGIQN